jgi:hypothetical protein
VNYRKFTPSSKFNPATVWRSTAMFNHVKKLVFFIGHKSSGSSMIGRLLDAHPRVAISHEYDVFQRWPSEPRLYVRRNFFKALYIASAKIKWKATEASKIYDKSRLCYKLFQIVPGQWQGSCDGHLEVVGDKKAAVTSMQLNFHPEILDEMKSKLHLPILFIYPLRHPLDMLSTQMLSETKEYKRLRHARKKVFNHTATLEVIVKRFQSRVATIHHWMDSKWLKILPVYNDDLIADPSSTLTEICSFLKISCTAEYIGNCSKTIFGSPSRSRVYVAWPSQLKQSLLDTVKNFSFLRRYQHDF